MGLLGKLFGRSPERPDDVYTGLRNQALSIRTGDLDLTPSPVAPIHGILMEMGKDGSVATLSMMADGSTSLYLSTGGGVIGAGEHESVRDACLELFRITNKYAADFIAACSRAPSFPLPGEGEVAFWLLTGDGVFRASGPEEDLSEQRHPFSALFNNCHEVLAEVRKATPR